MRPHKCQKWSNMVEFYIWLYLYLCSLFVRVCLVFAICISYFCTKSTSYIAYIEILACVWFWKKTLCHQERQWTWKYWDKSVESADRAKKRCWLWYLVEYIVGKAEKIFLPLGPTGFGLEEISNEKGEAGAQIYHMYTKHSGQVTLIRRPISSQWISEIKEIKQMKKQVLLLKNKRQGRVLRLFVTLTSPPWNIWLDQKTCPNQLSSVNRRCSQPLGVFLTIASWLEQWLANKPNSYFLKLLNKMLESAYNCATENMVSLSIFGDLGQTPSLRQWTSSTKGESASFHYTLPSQ